MIDVRLKGVNRVRKRRADGRTQTYFYHRATGIRLPDEPGSPEFHAAWAAAQAQRAGGGAVSTLEDLINRYRNSTDFRDKLRSSTQKTYERCLRTIIARFGPMPIGAATDPQARADFLDWKDEVAKKGTLRTAEMLTMVLALVLSWGCKRNRIKHNPLATWERAYKADRSDLIWSPEHIKAFWDAASPMMRLALCLALYTGQRQGDLLDMKWEHYVNGAFRFKQSKTLKQMFVPCIEPLRKMLDDMHARGTFETVHVITSPRGLRWNARNFHGAFKETCDRAGVPSELHFHDLRGTAITMLWAAGCNEHQIASITGHALKSVSTMLEAYTARSDAAAHAAMAKLENYLRTDFTNRLQTVPGSFTAVAAKDQASGRKH